MNPKILLIVGLAIFLFLIMSASIIYYTAKYENQITINEALMRDNQQQKVVIDNQSLQFNLFNKVAIAQQHALIAIDIKGREKTNEQRIILKAEPTCAFAVPATITNELLNYTKRIRASAMYADPGKFVNANNRAFSANTLTYCQAILWLNPLLAEIEQANIKLAAIRKIEDSRNP